MKNNTFLPVLLLLIFVYPSRAQVSIPDTEFEQVLIDQGIDTDGVVNGQLITTDALAVTELEITYPENEQYIHDLTGIEGFTNLETLVVNGTMIEELNIATLGNLKYLDCVDNMLTDLDVSGNTLLEYLNISSGGDVPPFNEFHEIDLSNNPNINKLIAIGNMEFINLQNGNNNPDMHINISTSIMDLPADYINGHTCIQIDNGNAAENNQFPYDQWTIYHINQSYDLLESCIASTKSLPDSFFSIYPNPTSGLVNIVMPTELTIDRVEIFDVSGRVVREFHEAVGSQLQLSSLARGVYIIKVFSGTATHTRKAIIE